MAMDNFPTLSIIIPFFNGAIALNEILSTLMAETYPKNDIEIIVVDDGSDVPLKVDAAFEKGLGVTIIRNDANLGRAQTRNIGSRYSNGAYLLFLDVDCIPAGGFITHALKCIYQKYPLVFGHIKFRSDPFFEYFENRVQQKRADNLERWYLHLATACVLIRRDIFEAVGGFSSLYEKYGMEDRDLLIRIHGKFPELEANYAHAMVVTHKGQVSVKQYVNKFMECGKYSIPVFRAQHPNVYRQMKYFVFDYVSNPWIRWIPKTIMKVMAAGLFAALMKSYRHLNNFRLKELDLKLLKGVAFLRGTMDGGD